MEKFHGYRIKFWEQLGFIFFDTTLYEGFDVKKGKADYGVKTFSLFINPDFPIASIYCNETRNGERHAMSSEDEAIQWFSSVSSEFASEVSKVDANNL